MIKILNRIEMKMIFLVGYSDVPLDSLAVTNNELLAVGPWGAEPHSGLCSMRGMASLSLLGLLLTTATVR